MTREQKTKLLDQLRRYFLINDEITLPRPQFDFILDCENVSKDLYPHYRKYGYGYGDGKTIKCKP